MKVLRIKEYDLPDEFIETDKLFSVFVFGLPRSGTSLMTKIVSLLGVNIISTSEKNKVKADKCYKKRFGEYHPNLTGFYEVTEYFTYNYLKIVSTPYSGCKMIIPVCGHRWEWVTMYPSKVIMMDRDPEEIRQSQMAYYRQGDIDIAKIRTFLAKEKVKLRSQNIPHLVINYRDVLDKTEETIEKVKTFIKSDKLIDEAVKFVNPEAIRFKNEELTPGL